jgi:hypothetical protein
MNRPLLAEKFMTEMAKAGNCHSITDQRGKAPKERSALIACAPGAAEMQKWLHA